MVTASDANTIIKVLAELNTEFTDIVFIAGSDRVVEFEKLFNDYNGKGEYEFRTIRVISAGERDPDSDGVEGMSASKMRELAAAGDLEGFASGLPAKLKPAAATIMKAVRMGLGMNEGVEPHPAGYQKDILTTPQYTLVIDTPGDLDWYKIGQHFPNLGTEDPDEYGQSDSDMSIVSANQKEMDDLKAKLDRLGLKYKEIGGTYDQPEIHSETISKNKSKVKLYTDPDYYGADVSDDAGAGLPVKQIPLKNLVGFEPDDKMKGTKSAANMRKMVNLIKSGKGNELPAILVRK